jgi:hypothetical protein
MAPACQTGCGIMRCVERGIEDVVTERLKPVAVASADALHRVEDFAVTHMRSLALGAAGAVLSLAAMLAMSGSSPQPENGDPVIVGSVSEMTRVPAPMVWQVSRKPVEILTLQAPQFGRTSAQYTSRSNAAGDREDALTFENATADLPDARVILRRSQSGAIAPSLFIDMTRQQAERGMAVARAGTPDKLPTKFSDIEAADMTFTDNDGRHQACLAFRSTGPVGLAGWYCAAQGVAVERPEVSCFIDRLTLLKAGDDRDLRKVFTEAEQRRRPCPSKGVTAGRKPTWLDADGKAPGIRGDVTGSIGQKPKR